MPIVVGSVLLVDSGFSRMDNCGEVVRKKLGYEQRTLESGNLHTCSTTSHLGDSTNPSQIPLSAIPVKMLSVFSSRGPPGLCLTGLGQRT